MIMIIIAASKKKGDNCATRNELAVGSGGHDRVHNIHTFSTRHSRADFLYSGIQKITRSR